MSNTFTAARKWCDSHSFVCLQCGHNILQQTRQMASYTRQNSGVLLVLGLLTVLTAQAAARSIEELYLVEVGPHDTAKAALQSETQASGRKESDESSNKSDSDEDWSSTEEMSSAIIACVSVGVVLICAVAVGVAACCLYGWCCFKQREPARKRSAVVITSSIPTIAATCEEANRASVRAAEKSPTVHTTFHRNPTAPPPYEFPNERPPMYSDIVLAPSAPMQPAPVHTTTPRIVHLRDHGTDNGLGYEAQA